MRNVVKLVCCFVLVLNAAGYTGSLQLVASNLGGGQVAIGYEVTSGSDVPVGFGLNVMLTNGATFGGVVSVSSYFPIYPSTIDIDDGVVSDWGMPVSPSYMPGSLGGIGTNGITLEMASMLNSMEVEMAPQDPRDINCDGYINFADMGIFVANWLISGGSYPNMFCIGDINLDGAVDMLDLAAFVVSEGIEAPPLNLSQLIVLQIDLNGAADTTLSISTEDTYRGGAVSGCGLVFSVTPASIVIPEPATLLLLGLGGFVLRRKK